MLTITTTTTTTITRRYRMDSNKAVHADDLLYVAQESARNKFNRTVDVSYLRNNLDPNGLSLIKLMLAFHNADFAHIQHHRCLVLAKFKHTSDPIEFYLDIAHDTYQKLFPVERVLSLRLENTDEPVLDDREQRTRAMNWK